MKSITSSWKVFRAVCIVQLILVAFKGMLSLSALFYRDNVLLNLVKIIAYGLIFWFLFHGLSMLSYNYPDIPLSGKQKRAFNILFLLNSLLVAFLFAQVVNTWWIAGWLFETHLVYRSVLFALLQQWMLAWIIFLIHLAVLGGLFRLRQLIYQNTISTWYQQFEKSEE